MISEHLSHLFSLMDGRSELHDAVSANRLDDVVALVSEGSVITKDALETAESDEVSFFISYFLKQCISAAREIFESLSVEIQPYLEGGVPPCFIFRQALIVSNGPAVLAVHDLVEEDSRESIIATLPDGLAIYDNILNPVSEDFLDLEEFGKKLKEALESEDIELCQYLPHFSAHDVFSFRHCLEVAIPIEIAIIQKKVNHLSILHEKGLLIPFSPEVLKQDLSETTIAAILFLFSCFPGEPVVFDITSFSVDVLVEQRLQNAITAWQTGAADVRFKHLGWLTPLWIAAGYGLAVVCQCLLDCGAHVNAASSSNNTPICIAAQRGHLDACKVLIEAGADITIAGDQGVLPLHAAASSGALEVCQYLLDCGADFKAVTSSNITALHIAAYSGHLDACKVLIEAGAVFTIANDQGVLPLHLAASSGALEVCQYLLDCGADVNAVTLRNSSPLYIAADKGHLDVSKVLIDAGADITIADKDGFQPLHIAAASGAAEVCQYLLDYGADVNHIDSGISPLCAAAMGRQLGICKMLVLAGADITLAAREGAEPLHLAACVGAFEVCQYLLDCGADVNSVTFYNKTPLLLAASQGHSALCRLFIVRGANATVLDGSKGSALYYAVHEGHYEVTDLLLSLATITLEFLVSSLRPRFLLLGFRVWLKTDFRQINSSLNIDFGSISSTFPGFLFRQGLIVSNASLVLLVHEVVDAELRNLIVRTVPDGSMIYENIVTRDDDQSHIDPTTILELLGNALNNGDLETLQNLPPFSADLVFTCRHNHFLNKLISKVINKRSVHIMCVLKEKGLLFPFPPEILHFDLSLKAITIIQFLMCTGFPGEPILVSIDSENIEELIERRLNNTISAWKFGFADANFLDSLGWTPLMFACLFNLVDVCEALAEHGANFSLTNKKGESPLHVASQIGSIELCELLLKQGCDLNTITTRGITPLFLALESNHLEVCEYLIRQRADPLINIEIPDANSLFLAVKRGNLEICKLLFRRIAEGFLIWKTLPLSQKTLFDLFRTSVTEGHVEICQLLLKYFQDINYPDERGRTLIFSATTAKMADFLLSIDADPYIRDRKGFEPYHAFAQRGNFEVVQYFLDRGFVVNSASNTGITPLHDAAMFGHLQIVQLLIQSGVDVDSSNFDGLSVLQLAISANYFEVVHYLIRVGADLPQDIDESDLTNETTIFLLNCKQAWEALQNDSDFDYQFYLDVGVPPEFLYRQALLTEHLEIAICLNPLVPDWLRRRFCFEIPKGLRIYNQFMEERTDTIARRDIDPVRDIIDVSRIDDRYCLGYGNFCVVYCSQFTTDGVSDNVAVKVPRLPEHQVEILREYNCLKHLWDPDSRHRNFFVRPFGLVKRPCGDREVFSLVMEKCEESLFSHLKSNQLDQVQLLSLCLQTAKAVCLAHQECIIHGDLKVENFLISISANDPSMIIVKLGDFGACRTGQSLEICPNTRIGSGVYTPPELYDGNINPTTAADVYSLGVCFLAIFGRGFTPNITIGTVLKGSHVPCTSIPFDRLRSFVERMVDHDIENRPSSNEVVSILESEIRRLS